MDCNAAAENASLLKDSLYKLKNEKGSICSDLNTVAPQKDQLLKKLDTFEETNRCLRDLLWDQCYREKEIQRLTEQKDMLLKKLNDSDYEKTDKCRICSDRNMVAQQKYQFLKKLDTFEETNYCVRELLWDQCYREKEIPQMKEQKNMPLEKLNDSDYEKTDTSRICSDRNMMAQQEDHLLKKLDTFEETNRCLREVLWDRCYRENLECNETQQKADHCKLKDELEELKYRVDKELEALKNAKQLEKQEAECSDEWVDQLTFQLEGKNLECNETQQQAERCKLMDELDELKHRVDKELEDRKKAKQLQKLEAECSDECMEQLTFQLVGKNLKHNESQQNGEHCKLVDELDELKRRVNKELEALKKAKRLQKQEDRHSDECVEQLTFNLEGKDSRLDEDLCAIETWMGSSQQTAL